MGFELGLEGETRFAFMVGCGGGGEVTPGMGTIFKYVEIEMNMSLGSFIQQTPIKLLCCAKPLSKNRHSRSLWNLQTHGRDQR